MKEGYTYYFSKFGNTAKVVEVTSERVLVELITGLRIWISRRSDFRVV